MKFDISALDKAKVLQALFKHAFVRGWGVVDDKANDKRKELEYAEAVDIIAEHTKRIGDDERVSIDYIHGRPIKLSYQIGKDFVESYSYDTRHGRYRFLYALITEFGSDSAVIIRKSYPRDLVKPDELDLVEMELEYKLHSLVLHFAEMKKNFNLN